MSLMRLWCAALILVCTAQAQIRGQIRPIIRGSVAVPPDPNEPVTGVVQTLTAEADRGNALALMNRARLNDRLHTPQMPPFELVANFTSTAGAGSMTETRMSGQQWRWSGSVGNATAVRIPGDGLVYGSPQGGAIPPAVHVLRNAIFWAAGAVPNPQASIRSSAVVWNGNPATCLLFGRQGEDPSGARAWDEDEYCIDDASGQLQVRSFVPGTYVDYTYGAKFHGRSVPSGITIYAAGKKVLDAQLTMNDAGQPEPSLFTPTDEMKAYGAVGTGQMPSRAMMFQDSPLVADLMKPVVVHASVDSQGAVVAEELSIAADPALAQTALDLVKARNFPSNGAIREIYVQVNFIAQPQ